jgi:hypothetical protein
VVSCCSGVRAIGSVIVEVEFVQVHGKVGLFVISVQLEVDDDTPPTGSGERRVRLVESSGYAVESDRLVEELIARSALNLNDDVVPGVAVRLARSTG